MKSKFNPLLAGLGAAGTLLLPALALAADEKPKLDTGDTAWMLTSTALVLMMTIPGLALFYGGMVRKKNVLATVMQSFAVTCLISVLWLVVGYSLAFTSGSSIIGGLSRVFLRGIALDSAHDLAKSRTTVTPGALLSRSIVRLPSRSFPLWLETMAILRPWSGLKLSRSRTSMPLSTGATGAGPSSVSATAVET